MSHPLAHPFSRIAASLVHAANRADWRRGALRRHPQPRVRLSHVPPRRPHGRRQRRQGLVRLVLRAPRRVQDHAQHLGTWRWTARGTVGEKQCARVCVLDPPAGCKKSNKTHTLGTCLLCFPRGLCRTSQTCLPVKRTSTRRYIGGGNKFNLSEWSPEYFSRLNEFVSTAGSLGIVRGVFFFFFFFFSLFVHSD